jgi:hypothetical protein
MRIVSSFNVCLSDLNDSKFCWVLLFHIPFFFNMITYTSEISRRHWRTQVELLDTEAELYGQASSSDVETLNLGS